jgi:predicted SAM-dependent methyltransferase
VIPRQLKAIYYAGMHVPMRLNAWAYRTWFAPASGNSGTVRVHFGPGQKGYMPGWINVDANLITARPDVWADLRASLPFRDGSVDVFYSHHMIEHLPDSNLPVHFREMYRCLKPGGVIRVGGPNGDEAIRNFLAENREWFAPYRNFPDDHPSLGGQLVNLLLCRGEHLTILTRSYLQELLEGAGFTEIVFRPPVSETGYPDLLNDALSREWELTPDSPHTLLVEAAKGS